MPKLDAILDVSLLDKMIRRKYVRQQQHDEYPLTILNYSETCTFDRVWNNVTLQCRGLIYNHDTGDVVARPFPKFFNYGEPGTHVPDGPHVVTEKRDGSLGILYEVPESEVESTDGGIEPRFRIATRGSFRSDQAEHATKLLLQKYLHWKPLEGYTYLFEIHYPSNRIVVDYGDLEDLVLLDVVNNETGQSRGPFRDSLWPGARVEHHKKSLPEILEEDRPNHEGYVVYWPHENYRLKVKHETYKQLHKILTNVTERTVWEYLSTGKPLDDLLVGLPDEFYNWLDRTSHQLRSEYYYLDIKLISAYSTIIQKLRRSCGENIDRKAFAALATAQGRLASPLFSMLDGRPVDDWIWKQIKPASTKPFAQTEN